MVTRHTLQLQAAAASTGPDPLNNNFNNLSGGRSTAGGTSNFYFYNSAAIGQGYADFKRVWGNRKLEDNWRRSKHVGGDITANTTNFSQNVDPDAVASSAQQKINDLSAGNYRQSLVQNLPLNTQKLAQSNQRIYNAYVDIAGFYRDILDDKKEAIESYLSILNRYPDDPNKAAIYYNLYRLYSETGDVAKADFYKNLLLKGFPASLYAKVILDPDYSRRMDDKDAEFNALYNQVYDLYAARKYKAVITKADSLLQIYPNNKLAAQLAYLRTIANGHQEKYAPFKDKLLAITTKYPSDQLIVPLVNQHMVYIEVNKDKMSAREFALMDNDPNEEPFIPATVPRQAKAPVHNKPVQQPIVQNKPAQNAPAQTPATLNNKPATTPSANTNNAMPAPPVVNSIFSLRDSTNYYFVINVSTGTTNLSSSRFGIGQFNRANYQGGSISHQLTNVGNDNQLIYVGRFASLNAVKEYARAIVPLMPQIMKVPADKYTFFIITRENLDKLADKKTLDSYIDFYQKTY